MPLTIEEIKEKTLNLCKKVLLQAKQFNIPIRLEQQTNRIYLDFKDEQYSKEYKEISISVEECQLSLYQLYKGITKSNPNTYSGVIIMIPEDSDPTNQHAPQKQYRSTNTDKKNLQIQLSGLGWITAFQQLDIPHKQKIEKKSSTPPLPLNDCQKKSPSFNKEFDQFLL